MVCAGQRAWTLGANIEQLTLNGNAAIDGKGNVLDNVLIGNSAANVLDGGAGNDMLAGALGDDRYVVDSAYDTVTEQAGEGVDSIDSSVTFTLASNVENLKLTGAAEIQGIGNSLDNILIGNAAMNKLRGDEGNDTYDGGAGDDTTIDTSKSSSDTYRWGLGMGSDTIADSGGAFDRVDLFAGITASQLQFARSGNNLQLGVQGKTEKLLVQNWYASSENQIESFRLSDGSAILAAQVNSLVQAMASFNAPSTTSATTLMSAQPVSRYQDLYASSLQ